MKFITGHMVYNPDESQQKQGSKFPKKRIFWDILTFRQRKGNAIMPPSFRRNNERLHDLIALHALVNHFSAIKSHFCNH